LPSLVGNGKLNTLPWISLTLHQYQIDAWKPRIGDLNNRMGGAFYWASQVFYKEDMTQKEFSSHSELKVPHEFP
jgi:hypothetical protein